MQNAKKTILVIDDDSDILDAIKFVLEGEKYGVIVTDRVSYIENLYSKDSKLPSLIILDILLSGEDGTLISKKLKSREETKHIPILMVSAHPKAAELIKDTAADDFLAKPFELQDLVTKVQKIIEP